MTLHAHAPASALPKLGEPGAAFRESALHLLRHGISVLPIKPGTKKPGYLLLGNAQPYHWAERITALPEWGDVQLLTSGSVEAEVAIALGPVSGGLVAIDFDYEPAPGVFDRIRAALPACEIGKRGAKGVTLFFRSDDIVNKAKWSNPADGHVIVEVLTRGQYTVVPPSVHPDTGQPYVWLNSDKTLASVPVADLPVLTLADLAKIDSLMIELDYAPAEKPAPVAEHVAPVAGAVASGDPFKQANDAAMANLDAWVMDLPWPVRPVRGHGYIKAVPYWRANKNGLQPHQRNPALSFYPGGIRDHSEGKGYSPVDVVMAAQGMSESEALMWLQGKLGIVAADDVGGFFDSFKPAPAGKAMEADDAGQGQDGPAASAGTPTAPAADPYAGLYDVPGLVGDITRWIVATSHRPLPLHALGAALVAVGTAAGRKYKGPTFSGTHLYIAALAVTGAGKDHPGAALLAILEAAGMGEHTGASSFKSASSIVSLIARSPLTAMKIDEFGAFLKKMNDVKGGSHLTEMSGELRGLWGSSFKVYKTPEWAGMASKTIHAPAVSIFGTTTPTDFYEGLRGADATNGFLNRFLVLEVAGRPAMQEPTADPSEVPAHIAEAMSAIYASGGNLGAVSRNDPGKPQNVVSVPWGEGAKAIYDEALRHAERIADQNPARGDYYSRSAEMALRMATIVGIGCDPLAPVVTAEAMRWAIRVVAIATKALFDNADALIADNVAQANHKMVKEIIRKAKGAISRSALTKAIDGRLPPRVIDDILGALIEAGDVEVVAGERGKNGKVPLSYKFTAQGA